MSNRKQATGSNNMQHMKTKMTEISELEQQLQGLAPGKSTEQRSSAIRLSLCEKLSDLILTDPLFASKKDCVGRLWRNCFYGRINELRSRIAREKRRQEKAQQQQQEEQKKNRSKGKGKNNNKMPLSSDNTSTIQKLEQSIQVFLNEAIILYQYLVDKYEEKLLPPSHVSTQGSDADGGYKSKKKATKTNTAQNEVGVIPGLYRMLINLGDLHRYLAAYVSASKTSYGKAESFYTEASKLAPGKGNPYNQLAVVAQLKDNLTPLSCVSLYWYARALLAIDDPFEISGKNLARLFDANRESLMKQQKDSSSDEKTDADGAAAKNSGGKQQKKKSSQELARSQRSATSRQFIANFVDVHYDFFGKADDTKVDLTTLVEKMEDLKTKFTSLLEAAAFGDALLCKMVTINAFSVYIVSHRVETDTNVTALARALTMQFGASMAKKVEKGLQKVLKQKGSNNNSCGDGMKPVPSVRLLLPLLIICDFVATFNDEDLRLESVTNVPSRNFCNNAVDMFWKSTGTVANLLTELRTGYDLELIGEFPLREYENLRGYAPFVSFIKQLGGSGDRSKSTKDETCGFATASEAMKILEVYSAASTQDSAVSVASGGSSGGSNEELNKAKIARFLEVVNRFADNAKGARRIFERDGSGLYSYISLDLASHDRPTMDFADAPETQTGLALVEKADYNVLPDAESPTKGVGNVLMYKEADGGSGPALLVPGAFLLNQKVCVGDGKQEEIQSNTFLPSNGIWDNVTPQANPIEASIASLPEETTKPIDDPMDLIVGQSALNPKISQPPPGLTPPPGFVGDAPPPGFPSSTATTSREFPTQGFLSVTSVAPHTASCKTGMQDHPTLPIYGGIDTPDLQTANPFAVPAAPAPAVPFGLQQNLQAGNFRQNNINGNGDNIFGSSPSYLQQPWGAQIDPSTTSSFAFLENIGRNGINGESNPEETSLLDSGLLSTLWTEEKNSNPPLSKNPFLT